MLSFSRWLPGVIIVSGLSLQAAPPLTTIQDILYKADGTRFSGQITISWDSFQASDLSNVAAQILRLPITNGYLHVQLVPTTTATSNITYSVNYNSGGKIQFSETWAVPPSTSPLRVMDVRLAPGSVISGAVQISDVAGLTNELNIRPVKGTGYANSRAAVINSSGSIEAALGSSSDCVRVDGTSGPCGGGTGATITFVDSETPAGVMDGANAIFTLSNSPNPAASLTLFRNGMLLLPALDYTLTGNSVAFSSTARPQPADVLLASYRTGGSIQGVGFVDAQTPSGNVDGANTVFTLLQPPNPSSSLALYRNGMRMKSTLDYNLTGSTITFGAGYAPQPGDVLQCSYRTVLP